MIQTLAGWFCSRRKLPLFYTGKRVTCFSRHRLRHPEGAVSGGAGKSQSGAQQHSPTPRGGAQLADTLSVRYA